MTIHVPYTIPIQHRAKLGKILADPVKFFKLLQVQDKYTGAYKPFTLYPEQEELLAILQQKKKIIVIKPRQIGVSTLLRAYAFWQTYVSKNPIRYGVLSFHDRSAKHLRKMDNNFLHGLPDILKRTCSVDNTTDLAFDDTGAGLSSYTARSSGGTRSFTLNSAHLSEFAFYPDQEEVLAQVSATVGTGQIVIESTPNTVGDKFHQLCSDAPDNGWTLVTFWWWQHQHYRIAAPDDIVYSPEEEKLIAAYNLEPEQIQWRREQIATVGIDKFRREYPASIEDAFAFGSAAYFDPFALDLIEPIHFQGNDREYEEVYSDDVYAMGVDPAAGVGGDYSTIAVVSLSSREVAYQYRYNKISPVEFAQKVLMVAQKYNDAMILCESNNHGHVVLQKLRDWGYANLWYSEKGKDWITSSKSKIEAYEILREMISQNMISRLCITTLMELRSMTIFKVAPEAPAGLHDDLSDSLALAYRCSVDIPQYVVSRAKQGLMDRLISRSRAKRIRSHRLPYKVAE
tara:strand:+ start:3103 stop:4641 length:1539 start_codon:yes stop_codon:yes gene_type:complete